MSWKAKSRNARRPPELDNEGEWVSVQAVENLVHEAKEPIRFCGLGCIGGLEGTFGVG